MNYGDMTPTSSDTESEEEFMTEARKPLQTRKWIHVVELDGIPSGDHHAITAKANVKEHVLVIKCRECTSTRGTRGGKCVKVLPLPETICVEELKVKVLPRGKLVLTAPFLNPRDYSRTMRENWTKMPTWIPIPVIYKRDELFNVEEKDMFPGGRGFHWHRIPSHRGLMQLVSNILDTAEIEKVVGADFVKDESTGKTCMIMKVNTIGFSAENIRVQINENERILLVEAKNEKAETMKNEEILEELSNGLPVKSLRREFILPEKIVDLSNIGFCVLKNGFLVVKVPLTETEGLKMPEEMMNAEELKKQCGSWKKVTTGKSL